MVQEPESNELYAKQYRLKLKQYAITIITIGCLLTALSLFFYKQANDRWNLYSGDRAHLYSLHDRLTQLFGYGGFIHDFKNLVLRKNVGRYEPKLRRSIAEIHGILRELTGNEQYSSEAVEVIRHTISQYERNLDTALQLIQQGANSEEIDKQVVVDDKPALEALTLFDEKINIQREEQTNELSNSFNIAFFVHIFSILVFLALLFRYFNKLILASQKERLLTKKAIEGSQAKSDFLSNMSHEIRTPLNGVMGVLQLLQRDLKKQENVELVYKALLSTKSLLTIINDILDFSKIEANHLSLEQVDFSMRTVCESVTSDLLPLAKEKDIYLNFEVKETFPDRWFGDPVRIRQIMLNLVSNSVKFTSDGGVTLRLRETQNDNRPGIAIDVTDTGIGMSSDTIERLFERFSQADNSVTRKYGGTGLGMSITHNLVKLMHGDIKVVSTEGKGTKFIVFLPIEYAKGENKILDENAELGPPDLSGKVILVAEDNEINQEIIKSMLEVTKATIHFAENGKVAVEMFQTHHPDLVFMDIQMPHMDGAQACMVIRELGADTPIVAVTANVMTEDIERYKETGFTDHLGKPIDVKDLYRTLVDQLS